MLSLLFGPARHTSAQQTSWWPVTSRQTRAQVPVDEDVAQNYSAVWAATRILAEPLGFMPLRLYRRLADDTRKEARDHPLYRVMRRSPNPTMTANVFRESRTGHQVNWGNAFAEIERDPRTEMPVALWPIHPSRVKAPKPQDRVPPGTAYLVRNDDGSSTAMMPDEVLHVPGALSEDGIWGQGVISRARESVGFGLALERHGATYFGGGAMPRAVVYGPGMRDPEQRRMFRQEWREIHGNPDSTDVAILPVESKLEKLTIPNEDSQFLETRKFHVAEIARWYGVPTHRLAEAMGASSYTVEQMGIEFVTYSLMPWTTRWEEQCNLKLLSEDERDEYTFGFDFSVLMKGDVGARMNAWRVAVASGIMTLNEVRRRENLASIGEPGDMNLIPLNMTTAEDMLEGDVDPADQAQASAPQDDPGGDQGDPEEDGPKVPGPEARDAGRAVLADALARWRKITSGAARRHASDPNFPAWLAGWQESKRATLEQMLATPAGCLGIEVGALADRVLTDQLAEIRAAYDRDTPAVFRHRLLSLPAGAIALAGRLLEGRP